MSADYQGLGFTPNLEKSDSLLARNKVRKTALEAEAEIVDTGYVTGDLIIDGAVTQNKIGANSIYGTHITNGEVGQSEIAGSAVMGTHIETEQIDSLHITGSSVDGTHIADGAITDTNIGTFDFSKGSGTIVATRLTIGTSTQVQQIFDEDTMSSDSAIALATQQSIKAYVDANSGGDILGVQIFS